MPSAVGVVVMAWPGHWADAFVVFALVGVSWIVIAMAVSIVAARGVEKDGRPRAQLQSASDRLARQLAYCSFAGAVVTFAITHNPYAATAALIVVTTGIAPSTTLAFAGAYRQAHESSLPFDNPQLVDALSSIDAVAFDERSAITPSELQVRAIYPSTDASALDVLRAAATAEFGVEDRIARGIAKHAAQSRVLVTAPTTAEHVAGQGVRALVGGEEILIGDAAFVTGGRVSNHADAGSISVFVMRGTRFLGSIALVHCVRDDARQAVHDLHSLEIQTWLASGATDIRSELLARELGVSRQGRPTTDLRIARVRAANGDTVDTVVGDCSLRTRDWSALIATIRLSRRVRRIIRANLIGTTVAGIVGIGIAAAGLLTPVEAASIHAGCALAMTANSARLMLVVSTPRLNNYANRSTA